MATGRLVGSVAALWRFPVKSMGGERLVHADLTRRGILGDRAFALIDRTTGKVASAKSVRLFPGLLNCRATFVSPPKADRELPLVHVALPNGKVATSGSTEVDDVLSAFFGRDVTLGRAAPDDFTIDQYHPDVENGDPAGYRNTVVEQKLGSAYFAEAGLPSPVPVGAFFDLFPVSLLTTSTLTQLTEIRPHSLFDERRFRMNVIVGGAGSGFVENGWVGQEVAIGETAKLRVAMPDPRCVMTTLAQSELPSDLEVLRTLTRCNMMPVGGTQYPCAGVYAVVGAPGAVRVGDKVAI
jgi:MOSC domain-containing protein